MTQYVTRPRYPPGTLCTTYQELCVWTEPAWRGDGKATVVTRLLEGDVFLVVASTKATEPDYTEGTWYLIVFDERIGWVPGGYISGA